MRLIKTGWRAKINLCVPRENPPLTSLLRAPSTYPFPTNFPKYWQWRYPSRWRALLFQYIPVCVCIYIYITRGRGLDFKLSILGEHQQRDNSWFILLVYEVGNSCSNRVIGDITNWSGCHSYKLLTILRDCKLSDLDFFPPRLFDLV